MSEVNERYWYNEWHLETDLHKRMAIKDVQPIPRDTSVSVYGDSITGDSLIDTPNGKIRIKHLYSIYEAKSEREDKEVVSAPGLRALNWTEDKGLHYSNVKSIIKHKTSKKKWRLKAGGKVITVTGDHSMIVFRDGVKMEVKPSEILSTDKILVKKKEFRDLNHSEVEYIPEVVKYSEESRVLADTCPHLEFLDNSRIDGNTIYKIKDKDCDIPKGYAVIKPLV